jgi:ABC-type Fe3+-siderophore transport system permease subunit
VRCVYFFEQFAAFPRQLQPRSGAPRSRSLMLTPLQNRLLSILFAVAVVPMLGIYALLMTISTPSQQGGMEPTMTMVCYIALTTIFSALITVVINFSLQLSRQAKGQFITP